MDITRNGSKHSSIGGPENFTGHALRTPLFSGFAPSRMLGGMVAFDPGARTVWHTHPIGQILIITSGCGRVQVWGGSVNEVKAGDVVWFAPGEKHWHGAAPNTGMSHIAIVETAGAESTTWLEPVTDEQYGG
jgi:quercetin dioxygenase-like cupin family protein